MKLDTLDKAGSEIISLHLDGDADDMSAKALNDLASLLVGETVEIGDGDNDFIYFFNDNADCLARVNINEPTNKTK